MYSYDPNSEVVQNARKMITDALRRRAITENEADKMRFSLRWRIASDDGRPYWNVRRNVYEGNARKVISTLLLKR